MSGLKRLRSIAHSYSQHVLGPFGPGAPERSADQRKAGLPKLAVDLVGGCHVADAWQLAFRDRFEAFLRKERIPLSLVVAARIEFCFEGQCRTPTSCRITIEPLRGPTISDEVTERLRRAERPGGLQNARRGRGRQHHCPVDTQ